MFKGHQQYILHLQYSIFTVKHTYNLYKHYSLYCGIIRIWSGSIFVGFVGSPPPLIYIIKENKFRKVVFITENEI